MLLLKKMFAVLLVLCLMLGPVSVLAGKNEDESAPMMNYALLRIDDYLDGFDFVFDTSKSVAYVNDDNEVTLVLATNFSYKIFTSDMPATIGIISMLWSAFSRMHAEFSNANFIFSVFDGDDMIFLILDDYIIDCVTFDTYPILDQNMST